MCQDFCPGCGHSPSSGKGHQNYHVDFECICICKDYDHPHVWGAGVEFDGFEWDSGNREKCQKHGVAIAEIESLFRGSPLVGPDPLHSQMEQRFKAAGKTAAGRALFVVFTWRGTEALRLIRPISARTMHQREVEDYEEAVSRF